MGPQTSESNMGPQTSDPIWGPRPVTQYGPQTSDPVWALRSVIQYGAQTSLGLSKDVKLTVDKGEFLLNFIKALKLEHSVIVSPSMSGTFALPLLMKHPEVFRGYVPVAPTGIDLFTPEQFAKIEVPTLIVYGENDQSLGETSMKILRNIPDSRVCVIEGAGHPAYLEKSTKWHNLMYNFLTNIPQ
ncbi:putative protein-lysine deacylase ABHD14B [Saccoglossus kowalevskii]|uniref:Alpha/beta hydrolase domain-containing protein 14B-like n=1 Tax=Saccoglossus kowalevskii TaxID=10224 RepID=A0ABM0H148_SACKO|nr:PREDICTED: alpha/beta hydrolase domain-containing protein 14B-like [Saccoglossus kowalevskii]